MPVETYSSLPDTVLAYKKSHHIGRFDPHAPESKEKKVADLWREIDAAGKACLTHPSSPAPFPLGPCRPKLKQMISDAWCRARHQKVADGRICTENLTSTRAPFRHDFESALLLCQTRWLTFLLTEIIVGARCVLSPSTTRRGTIAYVGLIPEIPGIGPWVGVKLDEPVGKNDGSVAGQRYFDCDPQYGVFVRPERVEVGNWKELGLGEDDDDLDEI